MPHEERIRDCFRRFREGDCDGAFFGLKDIAPKVLPDLMAFYRCEQEAGVRAFIVRVVWETRDQSVIPFLGEALRDRAPEVWKEALDGLVAFASPGAGTEQIP